VEIVFASRELAENLLILKSFHADDAVREVVLFVRFVELELNLWDDPFIINQELLVLPLLGR
jgi:hypothetical protein